MNSTLKVPAAWWQCRKCLDKILQNEFFQVEMSRLAKLSARAKRHLADDRKMEYKKILVLVFCLILLLESWRVAKSTIFWWPLRPGRLPGGAVIGLPRGHLCTGWRKAEHTWLKFQIGWRFLIFINIPLFSGEHHLTGDVCSHWSVWLKTRLPWIFNQITKFNDFLC